MVPINSALLLTSVGENRDMTTKVVKHIEQVEEENAIPILIFNT